MAHISNIPPEILNMICQTLSWRDIKNLELVLPFDLFTQSGIRDDVFERTLQMYIKETKSLAMDSVNFKKELLNSGPSTSEAKPGLALFSPGVRRRPAAAAASHSLARLPSNLESSNLA